MSIRCTLHLVLTALQHDSKLRTIAQKRAKQRIFAIIVIVQRYLSSATLLCLQHHGVFT